MRISIPSTPWICPNALGEPLGHGSEKKRDDVCYNQFVTTEESNG
jgi:hypothetical protein